jgi:hypothetical protein
LPLNKHLCDGTCSWPTIARAGITRGETNDKAWFHRCFLRQNISREMN